MAAKRKPAARVAPTGKSVVVTCEPGLVVVRIPIRTVSEANQREHWRTKATRVRVQRLAVKLALMTTLRQAGISANVASPRAGEVLREFLCAKALVTIARIAPRALDDDNASSSAKATRDSVAECLGVDDRDHRVGWCVEQRRGGVGEYAVEIRVEAE